ncbi:MAG: type II secretion system protein J [Opitutales bacterium]
MTTHEPVQRSEARGQKPEASHSPSPRLHSSTPPILQPSTPPTLHSSTASGFTLLEVLLAVAITGFVLAAASTMLVSVTNIWANRLDSNFFEDHVDGVAEFVQSSFTKAGSEITNTTPNPSPAVDPNTDEVAVDPNNPQTMPQISVRVNRGNNNTGNRSNNASTSSSSSLLRRSENPISWAEPPGFAGSRDPLINFKFRDNPPLLVNTDNAPAMGIDAFLYFDRDEGLSLLWYSTLQEEVERESDLRRTLISPYVKEIRYIYWDERFERWEEETKPQEGENDQYLLPRFIRLIFEKDEISMERTVSIPVPSQSALLF